MLDGSTVQQHWSWGVRGVAPVRCLKSHSCEKIEVAVEEEDRRVDLGASSGSGGRPPANLISTLLISHRWGAENRVTNVLQPWLPHCGPPMGMYPTSYNKGFKINTECKTGGSIMYACMKHLCILPIEWWNIMKTYQKSVYISGSLHLCISVNRIQRKKNSSRSWICWDMFRDVKYGCSTYQVYHFSLPGFINVLQKWPFWKVRMTK